MNDRADLEEGLLEGQRSSRVPSQDIPDEENLFESLKRDQRILLKSLVDFGFPLKTALFLILSTRYKTLEEVMNYVLDDERGVFNHPFLQKEDDPDGVCFICSTNKKERHIESIKNEAHDAQPSLGKDIPLFEETVIGSSA